MENLFSIIRNVLSTGLLEQHQASGLMFTYYVTTHAFYSFDEAEQLCDILGGHLLSLLIEPEYEHLKNSLDPE